VVYSFYVIAHNKKYESKRSEVATLKFDGDPKLPEIEFLKVNKVSENSVSLSWKYNKTVEGFNVNIIPEKEYPRMEVRTTKTSSITIDNLAPGAHYTFLVNAFKKTFVGPESRLQVITPGKTLPEVSSIQGKAVKEHGTSVKLSWDPPKDSRKVAWTYGVYYGIEEEELYESEGCRIGGGVR
jgi:hypothetical protein